MSKKKRKENQEDLRFMPFSWQGGGWDYVKSMPVFRFLHSGTPPFAKEAEEALTGKVSAPDGYIEQVEKTAEYLNMDPVDFGAAAAMDGMFMMLEGDSGAVQQAQDVLIHSMFPGVPDDISTRVKASVKEMPSKERVRFNATLNVEVTNFRQYVVAFIDWFEGVTDFINKINERR